MAQFYWPLTVLGITNPVPLRALWKYKAIYRLHDQQVGQWSDIMSVAVGV
jgi:hypothetical protein